jgi:hypothetical protein
MKKESLNEELNRMKKLMNFDICENSHDVLSDNFVKKSRISEQTKQYPETYSVKYKEKASYATGDSDPKAFVGNFIKNVITEINKNPDTKLLFANGALGLVRVFIRTGASNSWGKPMKPDMDNNYKSMVYDDNPQFYTASESDVKDNRDLADKRAQSFWTSFSQKLKDNGVTFSPEMKPKFKSFIVDTGGKTDDKKPPKYKNPGQHVYVNLTFAATKEIEYETYVPTKEDLLTGAYFCDGTNSKGQLRMVTDGCSKFKDRRPSAFEIKYKPNVLGNPEVIPIKRWLFYWSDEGKINKIIRVTFDETGKKAGYGEVVDKKSVPLDSEEMRFMLKGADNSKPEDRYLKNVKAYVDNPFPVTQTNPK